MKHSMGIFTIVAILFMVAGCASVSKEDCLLTDWYEIGRLDGRQGKARTAFQARAKACLEHGINADRQAYYQGHDLGMQYYCTEQKGFELGQQGLAYRSVCPLQLEPNFRAGYDQGIQSFCSGRKGFELGSQGQAYRYVCPPEFEPEFRAGWESGSAVYEYESKVVSLQNQLGNIERKIHKKEKALYADNLTDEQRTKIRSELRNLDMKYRDARHELLYLENHPPEVQTY